MAAQSGIGEAGETTEDVYIDVKERLERAETLKERKMNMIKETGPLFEWSHNGCDGFTYGVFIRKDADVDTLKDFLYTAELVKRQIERRIEGMDRRAETPPSSPDNPSGDSTNE